MSALSSNNFYYDCKLQDIDNKYFLLLYDI